jgi:branched-chain amino acid transport system permease protein
MRGVSISSLPRTLTFTLALAVVLLALPALADRAGLSLATEFCAVLAIAIMWNLLAGFAGIVFIGVPLFIGTGGYVFYLLANALGVPPYALIAVGGVAAALVALIVAPLLFRLNGPQLAIGSWVLAEIARLAVLLSPSLGGGGGMNLSVMRLVDRTWRMTFNFYAAAAVLMVSVIVCLVLMRSRFGLALRAVRDSEHAAQAMGVNVARVRYATLAIAAFTTGCAGAAYYISSVQISPASAFSMNWTAMVIFIVIMGGLGSIEGPIIGAIVYFVLREYLSGLGSGYFILSGLLAIGITIYRPQGLWGIARSWLRSDLLPVQHRPRPIV